MQVSSKKHRFATSAQLFYDTPFRDMDEMSSFRSLVVQLIYGNATPKIRSAVERFERQVLAKDGRHSFARVGVHLRWMEGACMNDMVVTVEPNRCNFLHCVERLPHGPGVTVDDICHMTDSYVERAIELGKLLPDAPRFLGSDQQQKDDTSRLLALGFVQYDNLEFGLHARESIFVDQLILMRGSLFIGNPVSTFSVNVQRARIWTHGSHAQ